MGVPAGLAYFPCMRMSFVRCGGRMICRHNSNKRERRKDEWHMPMHHFDRLPANGPAEPGARRLLFRKQEQIGYSAKFAVIEDRDASAQCESERLIKEISAGPRLNFTNGVRVCTVLLRIFGC